MLDTSLPETDVDIRSLGKACVHVRAPLQREKKTKKLNEMNYPDFKKEALR